MDSANNPQTSSRLRHEPEKVGSASGFLHFAGGYWVRPPARGAWTLATTIAALLALNLAVSIGLNSWHRWFFDMLERRDAGKLPIAIAILPVLIAMGAAFAVAMVKCSMTLQLNWRRWVTEQLLRAWVSRPVADTDFTPDKDHGSAGYRIVQDVRLALDPVVDLTIGFCNALIQGATFIAVLIVVGGSITLDIFGLHLTIPAYLAIAAVAYASVVSTTMYLVGQPLVRSVAEKNEAESQFLFELTRAAEGAVHDEPPAKPQRSFRPVGVGFHKTIRRWRRVIRQHCRLTWLTNSNSYFTPILPLLLAAPKYIHGELTLGAVIQVAAAFTIVLGVLNWFTDNYIRLAEWSASARRVDELRGRLQHRS